MEDESTERASEAPGETLVEQDPTPPVETELALLTEDMAVATPPSKPRKSRRKPEPVVVEEEYFILSASGEEVFASKDFFAVRDRLKKEPSGAEMVRRSDNVRLSYNTRAKPNPDIGPLSPGPFRKK